MGVLFRFLPFAFAVSSTAPVHVAPAATPALPPAPPTVIGMNVPNLPEFEPSTMFANLTLASVWGDTHGHDLGPDNVDRDGALFKMPAEGPAIRSLKVPATGPKGVTITCTFEGSGKMNVDGEGVVDRFPIDHGVRYHITRVGRAHASSFLIVENVDPKKPMRNVDCREQDVPRTARFRPHFLETLKGYPVLRFTEVQRINDDVAVPWSERHLPGMTVIADRDGPALEDLLEVARLENADPWFAIPWNADREYIANFAKLVHDRLPPNHRVYIEVGNEIWNTQFKAAQQAEKEGLAEGLSKEAGEAKIRRYAERTTEVMKIVETAFPDRSRLVRVLSTMQVWPPTATTALSFRDTAAHVDALATAAYWGDPMGGPPPMSAKDAILAELKTKLAKTMNDLRQNRAVAAQFHKRYIVYEGGQGLVLYGGNKLQEEIQHDPRMYDLYKSFIQDWKHDIGDVLCLFTLSASIGEAAWGITEYEGQPPSESQKLRAVLEER